MLNPDLMELSTNQIEQHWEEEDLRNFAENYVRNSLLAKAGLGPTALPKLESLALFLEERADGMLSAEEATVPLHEQFDQLRHQLLPILVRANPDLHDCISCKSQVFKLLMQCRRFLCIKHMPFARSSRKWARLSSLGRAVGPSPAFASNGFRT